MSDDESMSSGDSASYEQEDLDSDSDAESERWLVKSFKGATRLLQDFPTVPCIRLKFPCRDAEPDRGLWFPRFISALQRHENIKAIEFAKTRFDEDAGSDVDNNGGGDDDDDDDDDGGNVDGSLASEDMDRLFGTALPNHPTLRIIHFKKCALPHRYVRLIMSRLEGTAAENDNSDMWWFHFDKTELDLPSIEAISGALRRDVIGSLGLFTTGMTSPKCRIITAAAAECQWLDTLKVVERPRPDSIWIIDEEAFAPGSISKISLDRDLWFAGFCWTDRGAAEFFRQLRTNYRQKSACCFNLLVNQTRYPVDLLFRYNFTLRVLRVSYLTEDDCLPTFQLMRHSRLAREVHHHLEPSNYHVALRALWPRVLQDASSYPALLYRFLRRGNVEALADQLRPDSSMKRRGGRVPVRRSQRIRNQMT